MLVVPQSQEELQKIINNSKNLVLYFTAKWCGPCKTFAPSVEEVSMKTPMLDFVKIDIDQYSDIARKYHIRGIPSIVVIKDNDIVSTKTGAISTGTLSQLLSTIFA
jgi:thioredoxin